jgi:hypothetical protein
LSSESGPGTVSTEQLQMYHLSVLPQISPLFVISIPSNTRHAEPNSAWDNVSENVGCAIIIGCNARYCKFVNVVVNCSTVIIFFITVQFRISCTRFKYQGGRLHVSFVDTFEGVYLLNLDVNDLELGSAGNYYSPRLCAVKDKT